MFNPLYGNRNYIYLYIGVWTLIASVQFFIIVYYQMFGLNIAITESLVSNFIIAFFGLGLWFPVYYANIKQISIIFTVIQHAFISILASAIWLGLTYIILSTTFSHIELYQQYLKDSIAWRCAIGSLYYFLIVLFYALIINYQNFKEKQIKEAELKALITESELSSLKFQINPHFLFNSLNSISSLTLISPDRAQEMIIKLSEFLRYSLSSKNEYLTTLEEELKNITRYLEIEKIRFGKKLKIEKEIDGGCLEKRLPGLILQPLIENAIKYGLYESVDNATVKLISHCNEQLMKVVITNDFDPDYVINKGEGIGLTNIRNRLKLIYNSEDLMQLHRDHNVFQVTISFPQILKSWKNQ